MDLSYDGSFQGFLCATAEAINAGRKGLPFPSIRRKADCDGLFDETIAVATDESRAARLWRRLEAKAGEEALRDCFEAFCSDLGGVEDALASTISRMSREGGGVLSELGDPHCLRVMEASRRSKAQAHKLSGLIRFAELADGSWYAVLKPECDVLPLVGEHFAARFPDMRFVIHDSGRGRAILHEPGGPWRIVGGFGFAGEGELPLSDREREIRAGWQLYFKSVAIEERRNPRLQANHMPKKYWPFLPEMDSSFPKP
jgi:probable DNA metabolism protein